MGPYGLGYKCLCYIGIYKEKQVCEYEQISRKDLIVRIGCLQLSSMK
jgi:hypothetical protein